MTCAEFRENVHAFALGALDSDEQLSCAAHLAAPGPHQGCQAELERARDATTLLGLSLAPVDPAPGVWRSVAATIGQRAAGSRAVEPPATRASTRTARRWGNIREAAAWTLAAAAVAALFFTLSMERRALDRLATAEQRSVAAERSGRNMDEARQVCVRELQSVRDNLAVQQAALSLIQDPKTQLVQLAAQGQVPYRASAILNTSETRAVVLASGLAEQPGKSYELWVIRGGEKIPAGLLRGAAAGPTIAAIDQQILARGAPDALAVTIEPEGGSAQPTGPIVLLGTLPKI